MTHKELLAELAKLETTEKSLNYLVKKLLDNPLLMTEMEREEFIKSNKNEIQLLQQTREKIKEIKWELMSDKERQEYLEYQKKIKEKYSDD